MDSRDPTTRQLSYPCSPLPLSKAALLHQCTTDNQTYLLLFPFIYVLMYLFPNLDFVSLWDLTLIKVLLSVFKREIVLNCLMDLEFFSLGIHSMLTYLHCLANFPQHQMILRIYSWVALVYHVRPSIGTWSWWWSCCSYCLLDLFPVRFPQIKLSWWYCRFYQGIDVTKLLFSTGITKVLTKVIIYFIPWAL